MTVPTLRAGNASIQAPIVFSVRSEVFLTSGVPASSWKREQLAQDLILLPLRRIREAASNRVPEDFASEVRNRYCRHG